MGSVDSSQSILANLFLSLSSLHLILQRASMFVLVFPHPLPGPMRADLEAR